MMIARVLLGGLLLLCGCAVAQHNHIYSDGFENMAVTAWKTPVHIAWEDDGYFESDASPTWAVTANDGQYRVLKFNDKEIAPGRIFGLEVKFDPIVEVPVGAVVTGIEVLIHARTNVAPESTVKVLTGGSPSWFSPMTFANPPLPAGQLTPFPDIFSSVGYGGVADVWDSPLAVPGGWVVDHSLPSTWRDWPVYFRLRIKAPTTSSMRLELDAVAIRIHFLPMPTAPGARFAATGTLAATLRKIRPAINSTNPLTARGTVTANVNAMKNIAARIYDGPLAAVGRLTLSMTRDSGGKISTFLFPEFKARGTMAAVLRRGFSAIASASGTLSAALNKRRQAITKNEPLKAGGFLSVGLIASRLAVNAVYSAVGTLAVVMRRARTIAPLVSAVGTMTTSLRAMRPAAATASAVGTMTANLFARRPIAVSGAAKMSTTGTMTVALLRARRLSATMVATGKLQGDDGRATPDLTSLFWRPSLESITSDPWGNDIDSDRWDNDIDGD